MMNKVAQYYRELVSLAQRTGSAMESAISTRW